MDADTLFNQQLILGIYMILRRLIRLISTTLLLLALVPTMACSKSGSEGAAAKDAVGSSGATASGSASAAADDIIARVGDEAITFNLLNTMLNSSAMVGLSIPALGTPERNTVIITLLDKAISANLLYLDAKKQGTDRQVPYLTDMGKFEDAVLADMYKSRVLIGDIPVSAAEVQAFYDTSISPENELDDDLKHTIEARIRKQRYVDLKNSQRERLRAGSKITIDEAVLATDYDGQRSATDIVATVGNKRISWSDIEVPMRGADYRTTQAEFYIDNDEERLLRLQEYIDNMLMVDKARVAGMDKDEEFFKRTAEYRKTQLINVHRGGLIQSWKPSDDELVQYYIDNMDSIVVPEARKVQMVVLGSKEEAESVKAQIDSGKITIFQAAQQYSLDPNAKHTLGDMGWVSQGTGFPELDDFTFALEPGVLSGPVKSPAGWHLVKVLDVTDAQHQNIEDEKTRRLTLRMYLHEKLDSYVVDLRKNAFDVEVYDDVLTRQFQQEANYIAALNKKAVEEGSITKQRQQELQEWITPPLPPQ